MASTAKRVSRPIKREKDDKDHDDAMVDLSADASDRVPLHKAKKRGSPEKVCPNSPKIFHPSLNHLCALHLS